MRYLITAFILLLGSKPIDKVTAVTKNVYVHDTTIVTRLKDSLINRDNTIRVEKDGLVKSDTITVQGKYATAKAGVWNSVLGIRLREEV